MLTYKLNDLIYLYFLLFINESFKGPIFLNSTTLAMAYGVSKFNILFILLFTYFQIRSYILFDTKIISRDTFKNVFDI
jgi:hypothetical protein